MTKPAPKYPPALLSRVGYKADELIAKAQAAEFDNKGGYRATLRALIVGALAEEAVNIH